MTSAKNPALDPAVDQDLETPIATEAVRRTVPKGLPWFLGGAIVAAILMLMMYEISNENKQAEQKGAGDVFVADKPGEAPPPADMNTIVRTQLQEGVDQRPKDVPLAIAQPVGPLKSAVPAGADISEQMRRQAEIDARNGDAAREAARRSAPMALINGGGADGGGSIATQQGQAASDLARVQQQLKGPVGVTAAQAQAEIARSSAAAGGGVGGLSLGGGTSRTDTFLQNMSRPDTTAISVPRNPVGRHVILQGTKIPVVNMRQINSDLPGPIECLVTQDVYDSLNQRELLIPKGSRLYGRYASDIQVGQERVATAFNRLVLPDGRSVDLAGGQGLDGIGQVGWAGDVNNHFWKMFASSFATAFLGDWFDRREQSSQGSGTTVNLGSTTGASANSAAGQTVVNIGQTLLNRNKNIPPTITVPVGQQFFVDVRQDIVFPDN